MFVLYLLKKNFAPHDEWKTQITLTSHGFQKKNGWLYLAVRYYHQNEKKYCNFTVNNNLNQWYRLNSAEKTKVVIMYPLTECSNTTYAVLLAKIYMPSVT